MSKIDTKIINNVFKFEFPIVKLPKKRKNQTLIFAPFKVNFGRFCIFRDPYLGNGSWNHQNRVEIRVLHGRITQKHKTIKLWILIHFFTFLPILQLWGPVSRVNIIQKSKLLQNSNSPYQIYPKSQKSPKKALFADFHFFNCHFYSLTYGFRIIAKRFHIGPGRVGSHLIEHMLVHIRVTCVK